MNKTIQDYDKYAKDLADKFDRIGVRANDIKKLFSYHKKKNPRVLELGCAHGRDASEILRYTSNYIGVDASEELLRIAQDKLPKVKFIRQTFDKLKFSERSFDIIIEFASIMHYDKIDLRRISHNVHKWLDEEGLLMISMKEGKYSKFFSKGYGQRVQYTYEIDDIKVMIENLFEIINIEKAHLRNQSWFTMILRKM